jgi:hypothetical protein
MLPGFEVCNLMPIANYAAIANQIPVIFILIIFSGFAASSSMRFLDHTQRRATVGRTPLNEWSGRRRDLYLTTHNRHASMPPVGFEPTIAAGEQS